MKFLNKIDSNSVNYCHDDFFFDDLSDFYFDFDFEKNIIKNRKNYFSIKPGVSENIKKNSIKRDKNNNLTQQFINLNTKKGLKHLVFKNINIMVENLFYIFSQFLSDFNVYKNYSNFVFLHNTNSDYSELNKLMIYLSSGLESIFEIKTKKNNKKLKLKDKYSHEIVYIPRERRLKYVLRSLNIYKESFKNYNFWERFFWSFFIVLVNKDKSFLKKRREYIYIKSIKFFKKKIND